MVEVPGALPVTTPVVLLTFATEVSLEVQVPPVTVDVKVVVVAEQIA